MSTSKVLSFEDAAALIADGDVIAVNCSSGLNTPDRMLRALGERFDREGHPRGITQMQPISAGDMWGIKAIDHIAKPGLLTRVYGGSYPSGPSSAESPEIW
jgi:propionate CoA-transferase